MTNKYRIPKEVEQEIRARDKSCVYCGEKMIKYSNAKGSRARMATIEHFDNDKDLDKKFNIAICCARCNSSRGVKELLIWFKSPYCIEKGINENTVGEVVKKIIRQK